MQSAVFNRGRRVLGMCALAGTVAVGIAACGSSSGSPASASSGTSTTSASSREAAQLKFVNCMRSHGVNLPDPSANGGGFGGGGGGGGAAGGTNTTGTPGGGPGGFRALLSTTAGQAAEKACGSLRSKSFGFGGGNPANQAKFAAAALKFAECMRAHNIDVPDPSSSSGGAFGIFKALRSSTQTNSPAYKTALQACSSDLPFHRRGANGNSVGGAGA
jgi:hypothetical protein